MMQFRSIIATVFTALLLWGCEKDYGFELRDGAIGFSTGNRFLTKAGVESDDMPPFKVFAARGTDTYINDLQVEKQRGAWSFNPQVYWPGKDDLLFIAYFGAGASNVSFDSSGQLQIKGYQIDEQGDMMYSDAVVSNSDRAGASGVTLDFHRALTRMSFTVKARRSADNIRIKKLIVKTAKSGDLAVNYGEDGMTRPVWTVSDEQKVYEVEPDMQGCLSEAPAPIDGVAYMFPMEGNTVEVIYTYGKSDIEATTGEKLLDDYCGMGMSYKLNLTISLSNVSEDAEEEGWCEPPTPPAPPAPDTPESNPDGKDKFRDYADEYIHGDRNTETPWVPEAPDTTALNRDPVRTLLKDVKFMIVYEDAASGRTYALPNSGIGEQYDYDLSLKNMEEVSIRQESALEDFSDYLFETRYHTDQFESYIPVNSEYAVRYYFTVRSCGLGDYLYERDGTPRLSRNQNGEPITIGLNWIEHEIQRDPDTNEITSFSYYLAFGKTWWNDYFRYYLKASRTDDNRISLSFVQDRSESNIKLMIFYE